MTAPDLSILDGLTDAQKRALRAMSQRRQFPGKETFSAPGAWSLSCVHPRLAEYCMVTQQTARSSKQRMAFYLTPLGQQIRTALLETEK